MRKKHSKLRKQSIAILLKLKRTVRRTRRYYKNIAKYSKKEITKDVKIVLRIIKFLRLTAKTLIYSLISLLATIATSIILLLAWVHHSPQKLTRISHYVNNKITTYLTKHHPTTQIKFDDITLTWGGLSYLLNFHIKNFSIVTPNMNIKLPAISTKFDIEDLMVGKVIPIINAQNGLIDLDESNKIPQNEVVSNNPPSPQTPIFIKPLHDAIKEITSKHIQSFPIEGIGLDNFDIIFRKPHTTKNSNNFHFQDRIHITRTNLLFDKPNNTVKLKLIFNKLSQIALTCSSKSKVECTAILHHAKIEDLLKLPNNKFFRKNEQFISFKGHIYAMLDSTKMASNIKLSVLSAHNAASIEGKFFIKNTENTLDSIIDLTKLYLLSDKSQVTLKGHNLFKISANPSSDVSFQFLCSDNGITSPYLSSNIFTDIKNDFKFLHTSVSLNTDKAQRLLPTFAFTNAVIKLDYLAPSTYGTTCNINNSANPAYYSEPKKLQYNIESSFDNLRINLSPILASHISNGSGKIQLSNTKGAMHINALNLSGSTIKNSTINYDITENQTILSGQVSLKSSLNKITSLIEDLGSLDSSNIKKIWDHQDKNNNSNQIYDTIPSNNYEITNDTTFSILLKKDAFDLPNSSFFTDTKIANFTNHHLSKNSIIGLSIEKIAKKNNLSLNLNLTNAKIDIKDIDYHKALGDKFTISTSLSDIILDGKKNKLNFTNLNITRKDGSQKINISGKLLLGDKSVELRNLTMLQNDINSFRILWDKNIMKILGDIKSFSFPYEYMPILLKLKGGESDSNDIYIADIKCKKLILSPNHSLNNINFKLNSSTQTASFDSTYNNGNDKISLRKGEDGMIILEISNAGKLLDHILKENNYFNNGKIIFEGRVNKLNNTSKETIIGELTAWNIDMLQTDAKGKVSSTNIKKLAAKTQYDFANEKLFLDNGEIKLAFAQLTAQGNISFKDQGQINIEGNVTPFSGLNNILGLLLGGGKEGLLALKYTVTGPLKSPNVSVNKKSLFTLGGIRNVLNENYSTSIDEENKKQQEEEKKQKN